MLRNARIPLPHTYQRHKNPPTAHPSWTELPKNHRQQAGHSNKKNRQDHTTAGKLGQNSKLQTALVIKSLEAVTAQKHTL
jgi:hypothetical protein